MPLVNKRPIGEGFLAVWYRDESTAQLLERLILSSREKSYYDKIAGQPRRRKEWLTWHVMVREFLGEDIRTDYDERKNPLLINHPGHISVSHSNDVVALYYQPARCGVDIEDCGRRFERVSERYISPEEWQLPGASRTNRFQALMWCLKEAAYKYAGQPGLDFLEGIRVTHIDIHASEAAILLSGEQKITLKYEFLQGHCLAYTI